MDGIRRALPGSGNELIYLIKYSSLAYMVTFMELTGQANILANYYFKYLEIFLIAGAVYLGGVSLLPVILISGLQLQRLPWGIGPALDPIIPAFINQGLNVKFYFGGTSLLIVVGVAMDTVQQIESQLIMRHYEGFMKGARIRGRRG